MSIVTLRNKHSGKVLLKEILKDGLYKVDLKQSSKLDKKTK